MPADASIEDLLGRDDLERRRVTCLNFAPKSPSSWKAALALQIEIENFIRIYGIDYCGLLTLLFQDPKRRRFPTPAEAQEIFRLAARRILPAAFRAYIAVLDFHRSGAVHFHLVVACKFNLREGWDFERDGVHRELKERLRKEGRLMNAEELKLSRELCRKMTKNMMLKSLLQGLRTDLKGVGFPPSYPFELKPVRNPIGLARYLAGRFRESHARRDLRPHLSRCRRFSKSYPRCVDPKLRFSPVGSGATLFRIKKAAVGAALGIADIGTMIARFGPSWEHTFRDILRPVNRFDLRGFFDDQLAKLATLVVRHQVFNSEGPTGSPFTSSEPAPPIWTAPVPPPGTQSA